MTTGSVVAPDQTFSDALFLVNNPSWTYRDLQETPALIVRLMQQIQQGREKVAEARKQQQR